MSDDRGDRVEALQDLLDEIVEALDLDAEVEVIEGEDEITGTLHGEDMGLFIGRHGSTIDAIQHLAQRIVNSDGPRKRVVIDAEGYREGRETALHGKAARAAEESLRSGRPVSLEAMGAAERRIVHEHLRDRGDVETYSEGEEPDRHLVVAPLVS